MTNMMFLLLATSVPLPGNWQLIDNTDNVSGERTVIAYLSSLGADDEGVYDPDYVAATTDIMCIGDEVQISMSWKGKAPKEKAVIDVQENGEDPDFEDSFVVTVSRYDSVAEPSLKLSHSDGLKFMEKYSDDQVTSVYVHTDTGMQNTAFYFKGFKAAYDRVRSFCPSK